MTQSISKQTSLKTFARSTVALATLAFGLSFITAPAAQAAPLKIGMTFQELNNPYFVTMQKAAERCGGVDRCDRGCHRRTP